MRLCEACHKPDAPHLSIETLCKCGSVSLTPEDHNQECPALEHDVVRYYVLVPKSELRATAMHPEGELPAKWKGWQLVKDGRDFFRVRLMCRACIQAAEAIEKRAKLISKRRRALTLQPTRDYSQVYMSQGG